MNYMMSEWATGDPRPSEASEETLERWVQTLRHWPLSKLRRHQRINLGHPRRTVDLDIMLGVYHRAIDLKCFGGRCGKAQEPKA